jgi:hypothetical protein
MLLAFLLVATGLNLLLGFLVQFRAYSRGLRATLLALSGLFTVHLWLAHAAVFSSDPERWFILHRWMQAIGLLGGVLLLHLAKNLLRSGADEPGISLSRFRIRLFHLAAAGAVVGEVLLFTPGLVGLGGEPGAPVMGFVGPGILVPTLRVLLAIYGLYLLENTYRFAQDYQRRIGRLCFIGLGIPWSCTSSSSPGSSSTRPCRPITPRPPPWSTGWCSRSCWRGSCATGSAPSGSPSRGTRSTPPPPSSSRAPPSSGWPSPSSPSDGCGSTSAGSSAS